MKEHKAFAEFGIEDGGVLPCKEKGTLPNADKLILVQSSHDKNLEVGIMSLLNVLDAAEIMGAGTLSIPMLHSFPDEHLAEHMVTWTVDFAHTLKGAAADKLYHIKLVAPN